MPVEIQGRIKKTGLVQHIELRHIVRDLRSQDAIKPVKAELVQAVASCGDPKRVQAALDRRDKAPKHVDAAQGWVRRQVTRRQVAAAADWNGKGAVRMPSVDKLPDRFVRVERSVERKKIADALKAGETVPGAKLHTSESESVRLSK